MSRGLDDPRYKESVDEKDALATMLKSAGWKIFERLLNKRVEIHQIAVNAKATDVISQLQAEFAKGELSEAKTLLVLPHQVLAMDSAVIDVLLREEAERNPELPPGNAAAEYAVHGPEGIQS